MEDFPPPVVIADEATPDPPSKMELMLLQILNKLTSMDDRINGLETKKNFSPITPARRSPFADTKQFNETAIMRGSPTLHEKNYLEERITRLDDLLPGTRSKEKAPRQSFLNRMADDSDSPKHTVTLTRIPPSYSHIKLERLNLTFVIKFVEQIYDYQLSNGITIPVPTLLSTRARDQIISHRRSLTLTKFYALSSKELVKFLMEEVRPENSIIFRSEIERNVKVELSPNYKPSAVDFNPLYDALLVYRNRFIMVYEILAEDNEESIPPISNKEGGLIKLFLDGVPFDYGKRVWQNLKQSKFETIYSFLKEFFLVVEQHKLDFKKAKTMNSHFGLIHNETPSLAAQRPSGLVKRTNQPVQEIQDVQFSPVEAPPAEGSRDSSPNPMPPLKDHSPQNIPLPGNEQMDSDSDHEETRFLELDAITMSNREHREMTPRERNPSIHTSQKSVPNGCFRLLFYGSCQKGDKCTYSHEYGNLTTAHKYYVDLLANSKYRQKGPTTIRKAGDLGLIDSVIDPLEDQFDELLQLTQGLDFPESYLAKAVHREGAIATLEGDFLRINDCLFDTGALRGSYISKPFVIKNHHVLKPFILKVRGKVKLADNRTLVDIDQACSLAITFKDDKGNEHSGTVLFWVLPTCNHDMILGLPAILKTFSDLHQQMISAVVKEIKSLTSDVITEAVKTPITINNIDLGEVKYPWTYVQDEVAPEDAATPLPCSFTDALHFMEMTYEAAVQECLDLFGTHVSSEFASCTQIIQLLKSKGVNVFVPQNWEGIKGVPDLELEWKDGIPSILKPKARPVNPKLYGNAKLEFERLNKYFYRPSNSDIASCLVIAPKATTPFIRFCGDYVAVNRFIVTGHYPIPHVQHTLGRIIEYSVFLDFDLANSFHQFRLADFTSQRLSVQTPWGQVEPIFMPEGIGPASGILQRRLSEIFKDYVDEGWCIVIFDNLLAMATDYVDAYKKVDLILDRCLKHNIYLKFSKTWLGYAEANFFGYVCRKGCYELSEARKESINNIPFPTTTKKMQSFLGSALFFKSFVPHYSTISAQLYDTTRIDFNWDESKWTVNYREVFEDFKRHLLKAVSIHYADYSKLWILRTDASRFGIGSVLLQVTTLPDGEIVYEPIAFYSMKFSDAATRWSTIAQEAFAIYASVLHFAFYLTCKSFILETDHNNLLFMERSIVPMIIRWRVYLQSFVFLLRHISGKLNGVADWLSRLHERDITPTAPTLAEVEIVDGTSEDAPSVHHSDPDEILRQVHGGRMGHYGSRRTWVLLNEHFPGHRIPYQYIVEFIAKCATCQKSRLGMVDYIKPVVRHLKTAHRRSMIGLDTLTVTPPVDGFQYIIVVVNHFTKFAVLTATKHRDAITTAHAIFNYFSGYGLVDCIITDPGSEFINEAVTLINKWLGIRHRVSLVDRHESNGVEGTNKQILRHLGALVYDERVLSEWPTLLPMIQFMLNSMVNSETGLKPVEATFGSQDSVYLTLPEPSTLVEKSDGAAHTSSSDAQALLDRLNKSLASLYDISKQYQDKLVEERTKATPPEKQNMYQPGDFVLWQWSTDDPLPTKLSPKFVGPFEVLEQKKNDVSCKHVILGYIKDFHVSRLKIFHGSLEEAKRIAQIDNDQYTIKQILGYTGDPTTRTTMDFKTEYEDGSIVWMKWNNDISSTQAFESFCRSRPELGQLLLDADTNKKLERDLNNREITDVSPGDLVYVDLRYWGHLLYDFVLDLPDKENTLYLVEGTYYVWENKAHTKISVKYPALNEVRYATNVFIKRYGFRDHLPEAGYRLVNSALFDEFPSLKQQLGLKGVDADPKLTAKIKAGSKGTKPRK